MKDLKIILTGATGMVGEGVLFECLENKDVSEVLMVNRRPYAMKHAKLTELIVPDFLQIEEFEDKLKGYDACFYCAGVSSIGMNEEDYTRITYQTTIGFAQSLLKANKEITFIFVSGSATDSTEKGKLMWARVKGKTENTLIKMTNLKAYNFRPGVMLPIKGQKNIKPIFKFVALFAKLLPSQTLHLQEVAQAMINAVTKGYAKQVLEIRDIKELAKV